MVSVDSQRRCSAPYLSFEHGLHSSKRLSGRYDTTAWLTKPDRYVSNVDPIRIPQKYPGKRYFKGA